MICYLATKLFLLELLLFEGSISLPKTILAWISKTLLFSIICILRSYHNLVTTNVEACISDVYSNVIILILCLATKTRKKKTIKLFLEVLRYLYHWVYVNKALSPINRLSPKV